MSEISLLVPTRKRPDNIQRLVTSALSTADNPDEIQFVFYLDEDDPVSYRKLKEIGDSRIHYLVGPRILLSKMWNACFDEADGPIYHHCGDDLIFRSEGWDTEVLSAFSRYNDKVALVYGRDGIHDERLSTHGFVHDNWIETVGYFLPPKFSSDWNDQWLFDVAGMINRRHFVSSIFTEHMHPDVGKAERDQTHLDRMDRGARDNVNQIYVDTHDQRVADAKKLQEFIDAFHEGFHV